MNITRTFAAAGLALAALSSAAHATDGLQFNGFSGRTVALNGGGSANPKDSQAGFLNPASFAFTGNRLDVTGMFAAVDAVSSVGPSDFDGHPRVPAAFAGYSRQINDRLSFGVSTWASGLILDFKEPVAGATSNTSLTLLQPIIAPTLAYKLNDRNAIGASLLLAGQYVDIKGLEGFGLSNPGTTQSYGVGVSLGWIGSPTDNLRLSASYFSRVEMGDLDGYENHFADESDIDIPARVVLGAAYDVSPRLTVMADYNWINWKDIRPFGNPFPGDGVFGSVDGPGGGWQEQSIIKIAADYKLDKKWTLHGGASFSNRLFESDQNALNILIPATYDTHIGLGATYQATETTEWSFGWNHAFNRKQTGTGVSTGFDVEAKIHTFGVTYAKTF